MQVPSAVLKPFQGRLTDGPARQPALHPMVSICPACATYRHGIRFHQRI